MQVLIINGSPRKNGVTAAVLHRIEENLQKADVEVFFYNLGEIIVPDVIIATELAIAVWRMMQSCSPKELKRRTESFWVLQLTQVMYPD